VRSYTTIQTDADGLVLNPLREKVAKRLETERVRRKLTQKDFVCLLRQGMPDRRFSYDTYIRTARRSNNITLSSLERMACTLNITIADFLYGAETAPDWVRRLDGPDLRALLSHRLEKAREQSAGTQADFAGRLGIAEKTYRKIIRQKTNFTIDTVTVIANSVGETPLAFLFE
jgi:transcriptional regulator with XRE-family HTH domain